MDRVTFLARLRERLDEGARAFAATDAAPSAPASAAPARDAPAPDLGRPPVATGRELVELFAARLRESGGVVDAVASRAQAWAALERLAGERDWRSIACAPGVRLDVAGDGGEAHGAGLSFTLEARAADFGLTEADWAVAETGSVVVRSSAEVRRGYSLVPPAVGFFVSQSRLRATLGDVLGELPADPGLLPSCVSFISGPSGTSDLAAVHVVGVHGPGEVYVWVIEHDEPAVSSSSAGPDLFAGRASPAG
jgi:L-lactate dehydrogenase complex protein LldG